MNVPSFDFGIMLRQQFVEKVFRDRLARLGVFMRDSTECLDFQITGSGCNEYVYATLKAIGSGREYRVKWYEFDFLCLTLLYIH